MIIDLCLMNRDQKVLYFTADITDIYCDIIEIGSVISSINCPEFILNSVDKKNALKFWWQMRCMPTTRRDFANIITMLYQNPLHKKHQQDEAIYLISLFAYAQNLKDHYWINPAQEYKVTYPNMSRDMNIILKPAKYEDISFYYNIPEDDDVMKLVLDCQKKDYSIKNYLSPNICVQGDKIKFWQYDDEENAYLLHKYLHGITEIEENEFKVYEFIKKEMPHLAVEPAIAKIDLANYDLSDGRSVVKKYVTYKNFIDATTEMITGEEVLLARGPQRGDILDIFYDNCSYLSIPINFVNEVIYMSNALDRHFGMEEEVEFDNIGFIRDVETKQFIAPAPIFGNSYFQEIL